MNSTKLLLTGIICFIFIYTSWTQEKNEFTPEELEEGQILLSYDREGIADPSEIVKKFDGLRVSDVLDALQAVGLQDLGLMDKTIRPLWRDMDERLGHRIYGVAVTYQYLPTNKPQAGKLEYEEFRKWHGEWYSELAPEKFKLIVKNGNVVVIDAHDIENVGFVGSNNALGWMSKGANGVITNGCCRDTDEIILQRIPVYSKCQGGGTRPGRIEAGAINIPVTVGGVLVRPGDFVVADGDGVVVVPQEHIEEVVEIAWDIASGDKKGRKKLYEQMNMKLDKTVR